MTSYKVVVNQQTKQYIIKPYGVKWMNFVLTPELISPILDQFTESTPTLEDDVILAGGKKATVEEVISLVPAPNPEIYIGSTQPANTFKLWIDTSIDDVDILRAIRDANPQSTYLTALFDDTKDSHTEWWDNLYSRGALFGDSPMLQEMATRRGITLPSTLDINKCYMFSCDYSDLTTLDITGLTLLQYLYVSGNNIVEDSIQKIFSSCVNSNLSGNQIDISQGGNAPYSTWSSQAKADYGTLISRGWNIQYNNDAP